MIPVEMHSRISRASTLVLAAVLAGCERDVQVERATTPPGASAPAPATAGEFQAGPVVRGREIRNPQEQNLNAGSGQQLYTWFNCAGCHGARGGGGIGPPLRDKEWIYGSDPASIFQTIAQGRPNGMPAFAGKLPDEHIWRLEMYVRSFGGADPPVRAGASTGQAPTPPPQAQ
jgi:cytochrome c oxidase cbb3-type subunit 3